MGLIPLPAVREIQAFVKGELKKGVLTSERLDLSCSLGEAKASANFRLGPDGALSDGKLEYTLNLSSEGAKFLSPYLQLAAQGKGTPSTQRWSGTLVMVNGRLTGTAVPEDFRVGKTASNR